MKEAQALKSEQKYRDAVDNLEIIRVPYPGEGQIMKLMPLTEHWSKQKEQETSVRNAHEH